MIFAEMQNLQDIQMFINSAQYKSMPKLILGGGSNVLLTKDFEGVVVKINTKGIFKINETEQHVWLNVQSGVAWDDFVNYCIDNDFGGIENLSLIQGNVGSSPIQNIGAYGVEVKDSIDSVEVVDIKSMQMFELKNEECNFAYRNSIFKQELKDKVIIVSVTYKLTKKHQLHLEYGAITDELNKMGITQPNIRNVAKAICNIRNCKLPDPKEIGNAGSFFKNPTITEKDYSNLKSSFPEIPSYTQTDGTYKIPAGWLIEQCGWKGYKEGNVGVHANQALVLVNYGNATGKEVLLLSEKIQQSVKKKFGLDLQTEVNIF